MYGRKENWINIGKNKKDKAGSQSNDTIHHYHLYTKYGYSSLHGFTEIFDEKFHHSKYGKKQNRTNTGKNKQEKAGCNPTIQYIIINLHIKNDYSSLHKRNL